MASAAERPEGEDRFQTIDGLGPRVKEGPAWHREYRGINVVRLQGSHYDMGRQHGVLLRKQIPQGPIPYYRTYVLRMLENSGFGLLAPAMWALCRNTLGRRVRKAIPDFAMEAIQGLADGSGVPMKELLEGYTMPDSLMWLAARSIQLKNRGPALHHRLALGLGCTSAIAWGDATADGRLLHARNFDYHGVDSWPKTSTLLFHNPDEGQRYVSVASAGVLLGGATAMNEAGLSLTVHQHMFTDATRLGGTPIGVIGDRVMRDAENLDDAQAIIEDYDPIGCWTYLVTDGKNGEVLCFEENPNRQVAMRYGQDVGTLGYSNIYLDSELGKTEQNLYPSYWRANLGRYRQACASLEAGKGSHTPESVASILAQEGSDESCRIRDAVAMMMTVASVVFKPEDGVVWVATGQVPTSQNEYVPFSLADEDVSEAWDPITPSVSSDVSGREAFEAYTQAYLEYFDGRNIEASRSQAERARTAAPDQSLYHLMAALLALRDGDYDTALKACDSAIELGHCDVERVASFHLWKGCALDLLGQRSRAVNEYEQVLVMKADNQAQKAARRNLKKSYRPKQASKIGIEFGFIDVVDP